MRVALAAFALALAPPGGAAADVILSAEKLNAALEKMQSLQREGTAVAHFQLGVECDALATLLSDEVAGHGMQEKALIDAGLARLRELQVAIEYDGDKRRFFYDGAAFRQYLKDAPRGPRAAEAAFWLVENEFYRAKAKDPASLLSASEGKQAFLRRYPKFKLAADVGVFLAIDYRDLYRHYQASDDAAQRDRFRELARTQFRSVVQRFPGSEQAKIAEEMLRRLEDEIRSRQY